MSEPTDGDPAPAGAIRLTDAQRLDWLRLIRSENVGPTTFRSLINRFGGAGQALEAIPELSARGGAKRRIRLCSRQEAEAELAAAAAAGARLLAMGEADYPRALGYSEGAPPLIYVKGKAEILQRPIVSVVGSRNCSAAGAKIAARLAADLGATGVVIASGLARGIDTAAHRSALDTGTVAVLAGGVDSVYPPQNADLYAAIAERGAIVSEMPMGYSARGRDFPRRNRIISGLAVAIIVVEAARRSGSLITARLAGEQGREVFAVPGSPLDPRAEGTNQLLKQGAGLVTEAGDVLDAIRPLLDDPDRMQLGAPGEGDGISADDADWHDIAANDRERVVAALGPAPIEVDEVIRFTGLPTSLVLTVILELELAGRLTRHPGQRVALI